MTASSERRARSEDSPQARAESLRERMRRGELEASRVELSARCGHPAAALLFPEAKPSLTLIEAFSALSAEELKAFACAGAEGVIAIFERYRPSDHRPRSALEAARRGGRDLASTANAARAAGDAVSSILMIEVPPDQPGLNRWHARRRARNAAYAAAAAAEDEPLKAARQVAKYASSADDHAPLWLRRRVAEILLRRVREGR